MAVNNDEGVGMLMLTCIVGVCAAIGVVVGIAALVMLA